MRQTRLTLALTAALAAAAVLPSTTLAADLVGAPPAAAAAPEASQTRLLVLPFTSLSDADRDAWIGRAISEALTADLSIDRTLAVATNKDAAADDLVTASDLGRIAGVDRVVFGTFQKVGGEIRITGQIADVATGKSIAGIKATGPLQELFTLQDSLVHQIQIRMGRPGLPVAPPPSVEGDLEKPFAREERDDDGVLGVPRPDEARPIGWLDDGGPAGDLADARRVAHDRFVFDVPAPVYYPSFYNPYYAGVGYGYGYGYGRGCYRPYPVYHGNYYPTVTVTTSDGDGWNGRSQTRGHGIVGGGMRATPKYQPYQGVTAPRTPTRSTAPTQASTLQVGNRRMPDVQPAAAPRAAAAAPVQSQGVHNRSASVRPAPAARR